MERNWRLLLHRPLPAPFNMAVDEVLLDSVIEGTSSPTLRFYDWENPTLSVGFFQKLAGTELLIRAKSLHLDMVRRPTGGRAVLHHREITYALALPLERLSKSSVKESAYRINDAFRQGLAKLGIPAAWLLPQPKKLRPGTSPASCFALSTSGEVGIAGKKLLGSAQLRKKNALLQHGSLLLSLDPELHAALFPDGPRDSAAELAPFLPPSCKKESLIEMLAETFEEEFQVSLEKGELTKKEKKKSRELAKAKYQSHEWTFSR